MFVIVLLIVLLLYVAYNASAIYAFLESRKRRIELAEQIVGPPSLPLIGNAHQFPLRSHGTERKSAVNNLSFIFRVCGVLHQARSGCAEQRRKRDAMVDWRRAFGYSVERGSSKGALPCSSLNKHFQHKT